MSEALYRKYRPQTFEEVVGQTHIERTLKNAIEADKVSHAYLFCGPRGTGKTTTARLLAKALLCEHGPTSSPDGTCAQCQAIAEGTHPDVNELDAASRTGVDNVREEIINRVQFAPTQGRYKIYIIDEVHMLSTAAFNALLKTLEEPPEHVVFILCTTDPQKIPETIHSRCQRFDFHRLTNEEIIERLAAVCDAEGIEYENDALDLVAHRAQGGMRDALTTLEQLAAFGNGNVTLEVAENVLGALNTSDMAAVIDHIAHRDAAKCFLWVADFVETGADLAQFARDLAEYVRNLYVMKLTDGAVDLGVSESAKAQMVKELELFGTDRLAYLLDVLGDLTAELRASINPRLSFEIALTRMVRPDSDLTLQSLAARIEVLERALASGVQAQPAVSAPAAASAVPAGVSAAAMPAGAPAAPAAAASALRHAASAPAPQPTAPAASRPASSMQPPAAPHPAAVQSPAAPRAAAASAPASRGGVAGAGRSTEMIGGAASPETAAKIGNPASLQRGWQSAVNAVKEHRAAYGALLLSAKAVPEPDCSGIRVEFSPNNTFAYGAVQKPEVRDLLATCLSQVFGGSVPFCFVQGGASSGVVSRPIASAPVAPQRSAQPRAAAPSAASVPARPASPAAAAAAAPNRTASAAPAVPAPAPVPKRAVEPAPWEDDVVPYDDADAMSYGYAEEEPPQGIPAAARNAARPTAPSAVFGGNAPARPAAPMNAFQASASAGYAGGAAAPASAPKAPAAAQTAPAPASPAPVPQASALPDGEMDAAAIFGSLGVSFEEIHE